jgi:hypothetical protein
MSGSSDRPVHRVAIHPLDALMDSLIQRASARWEALAFALWTRAAIHAAFAVWLLTVRPDWGRIFEVGAFYGFADGGVALFIVSLIVPVAPRGSPRFLAAMTFVDAMGRLGTGAALLALPGIPDFFVTLGMLFGVVGVCAAAIGLVVMGAWLVRRLRSGRGWSLTQDELFDPVAGAALIAFVTGYILFLAPPTTSRALQTMGAMVCGALTVMFVVAGIGAARAERAL